MATLLASAAALVRPESVGPLLIEPLQDMSHAMQVATVLQTDSESYRLPVLRDEATAAWTQENAEIDLSDATFAEVNVGFFKLAGLVRLSAELVESSEPEAAATVGASLARSIARSIDLAYWGSTVSNGPSGLESLASVQTVDAGATWTSLDPMIEAISKLQAVGAKGTNFVTAASTALELAKLKRYTGATESNENLLQPSPTDATVMQINGVPISVVPDGVIDPGVVWLSDKSRSYVILKRAVTLDVSREAFFTADAVAVKATVRTGFGFPSETSFVRIALTEGS
ncbi:MAG: phage major capsid protein [Actinomycetia bacterium]|nr:phage major capsid protein [Actinomycetes bacterium]